MSEKLRVVYCAIKGWAIFIARLILSVFVLLSRGPRYAWLRSNEWAWYSGLFLGAVGVTSINEFGVAIILLVLSSFGAVSQLWKWKPNNWSSFFTVFGKVLITVIILAGLLCCIGIVNENRAGHPWSQLPKAIADVEQYLFPSNPPPSELFRPPDAFRRQADEVIQHYASISPPAISAAALLHKKVNDLASEILDFADEEDKASNDATIKIMSYPSLSLQQKQAGETNARNYYAKDKQDKFVSLYWNQVQQRMDDLSAEGVDVSPVTRAAASKGPEYVALRLSALAERIGKHPPFERVLTPVEAIGVVRGIAPGTIEIYADSNDRNSQTIAETLRKEFKNEHWNVNNKVYLITENAAKLTGIHVIYPSHDETVFEGIGHALSACDIAAVVDVREVRQPPTIIKIEVWPDSKPQ